MSKTLAQKLISLSEKGELVVFEPIKEYDEMDIATQWYVGIKDSEDEACVVDYHAKTLTLSVDGCIEMFNKYIDATQKIH